MGNVFELRNAMQTGEIYLQVHKWAQELGGVYKVSLPMVSYRLEVQFTPWNTPWWYFKIDMVVISDGPSIRKALNDNTNFTDLDD